jgi:hypothetical protein
MLLPALSSAREKIKAGVCLSNVKQVGVAIYSYTADGQGILPGGLWLGQSPDYNRTHASIGRFLAAHTDHPAATSGWQTFSLLMCPSFTTTTTLATASGTKQFLAHGTRSDNYRYFGYPQTASDSAKAPLPITAVEEPSEENALAEIDTLLLSNPPWPTSVTPRHGFKGGAGNRTMLFFDGHALISTKNPQN